jgi:hypothetical protein
MKRMKLVTVISNVDSSAVSFHPLDFGFGSKPLFRGVCTEI